MSRFHASIFTKQVNNAEIVGLCDTHKENLDRYQREIFDPIKKKPPQFADYRDLLDKVKVDAVLIVTPHADHFQQITDSLDAGLHVLAEKPMVITSKPERFSWASELSWFHGVKLADWQLHGS
jgi:predicted dehydrogenase